MLQSSQNMQNCYALGFACIYFFMLKEKKKQKPFSYQYNKKFPLLPLWREKKNYDKF